MEYTVLSGPHAGEVVTGAKAEIYKMGDDGFLWLVKDPVILAAWVRTALREYPKETVKLLTGDERMIDALFGRIFRDSRFTVDMEGTKALLRRVQAGEDPETLP